MISSESRRDWMHCFGSRLMKLEPTLDAVTAAQHAVAAYDQHATDSEPEGAAANFARENAGRGVAAEKRPVARQDVTVGRRQAG